MYHHHYYLENDQIQLLRDAKNNAKVDGNANHVSVSTYCNTMRLEMMAGKGKSWTLPGDGLLKFLHINQS